MIKDLLSKCRIRNPFYFKPSLKKDVGEEVERDRHGAPVIGEITVKVKLDHALGEMLTNVARFKFEDTTLRSVSDDDGKEDGSIGGTIGTEIEVAFRRPENVFDGKLTEKDYKGFEQYLLHTPDIYNSVVELVSSKEVGKK